MPSPLTLPVRYTRHQPPVGAPIRGGHPLARSLILCCPLSEGAGSTAHDATTYHRHGAISGDAAWSGRTLAFTGGSGLVSGASPFGGLTEVTFWSRVLISSSAGSAATWFSGNTSYNNSFLFARDLGASGSSLSGQAFINGSKVNYPITFDTWHTVCGVLHSGTLTIYVDGSAVVSGGVVGGVGAHDSYQVGTNTATNLPFTGLAGLYGGFSRALSPAEVRSLYLAPFSMF